MQPGDDKLCAAIDSAVVTGWIDQLATFQRDVTDAERIDQLRALEQLKAAAAAAQARITVDLDESVRAAHAARGIPAERQGRGVAGQIALARQESPYKGGRHLGLANVLAGEMPHTLAALQRGVISEWRATLLARETLFLSREHRPRPDTPDPNGAARQENGLAEPGPTGPSTAERSSRTPTACRHHDRLLRAPVDAATGRRRAPSAPFGQYVPRTDAIRVPSMLCSRRCRCRCRACWVC